MRFPHMAAVQFALEAPKRSSLSTAFSDRSFQGTYNLESKTVTGTIMDGEDEPEYVISAPSHPFPASSPPLPSPPSMPASAHVSPFFPTRRERERGGGGRERQRDREGEREREGEGERVSACVRAYCAAVYHRWANSSSSK